MSATCTSSEAADAGLEDGPTLTVEPEAKGAIRSHLVSSSSLPSNLTRFSSWHVPPIADFPDHGITPQQYLRCQNPVNKRYFFSLNDDDRKVTGRIAGIRFRDCDNQRLRGIAF